MSESADDRLQRLLIDSVQDYAIFRLDPQGLVSSWNSGAERIKGYRAQEIIGCHFSKFYRPEDVWKCAHVLEVAAREGRIEDEGYRVRKDGSAFWANVVITALRDANGELVGFAKVTRDLTERRNAEQARALLLQQTAARSSAEQALAKLTALQRLTASLAAASTPLEVAQLIAREGAHAFGADAGLFLRARRGDRLELMASHSSSHEASATLAGLGESYAIATSAFRSGTPVWLEETRANPAALCALPLVLGAQVSALVEFHFARARAFPPEERASMETFAVQAAQAFDRAEVYAREVRSRRRVEAIGELGQALAAALSVEQVARVVVEEGTRLCAADICTLHVLDEERDVLELLTERGCAPEIRERIRRIDAQTVHPVYQSVRTGQNVWVESAEGYADFLPALAQTQARGDRAQAFWSAPLIIGGRPIGLLAMGFYSPRRFSRDEREFVAAFTRLCAEALLRARRLDAERAALALAERLQASLATTLRSIGDAVITTDVAGRIAMMNAVAVQLTGYSEQDARGRPLHEVFHIVDERTREPVPDPAAKVLETGAIVALANHTVLLARDGREIPIEDSGAPIRREDGPIEGVVLVFRDITDQRRREWRRALMSEATGALAESLDAGASLTRVAELAVPRFADLCAIDLAVEGGRRLERIGVAHRDPARLTQARALQARHPLDMNMARGVYNVLRTGRSEHYPDLAGALSPEQPATEGQRALVRALALRSALLVPMCARERVIGVMSFVYAESERRYDVDDLRFAEDLARRCALALENAELYRAEQHARKEADVANRAKDEFLAVISHELRTPLNAILGWAKVLTSTKTDESKLQRALDAIERNAIAMAQLVEDLLDVSRIIGGKMRLEIREVEIERVVEAAVEALRPAAQAREVRVSLDLGDGAGRLAADPTRLQQILWNLLSNAVKFSAKGGLVEVQLTRSEAWVELRVSDHGKGIQPSFLPFVFEPFRQEEGGTTRARGGLGLGLAITRQLVELHGGEIAARSDGENRGSTFIVRLPRAAKSGQTGERAEPARAFASAVPFERPAQLRGLRVLVVDDEPDARQLIQTVLEECGSLVATAGGVEQALQALERERFDVLLSDIGMPDQDGFALIERVRALPASRGGTIPAAALTAYVRAEDKRRVLHAGYAMHVPKPVEPAELVAVVANLTRFAPRADA